jgi:hypothetical protein
MVNGEKLCIQRMIDLPLTVYCLPNTVRLALQVHSRATGPGLDSLLIALFSPGIGRVAVAPSLPVSRFIL